jgi:hypothetical protein
MKNLLTLVVLVACHIAAMAQIPSWLPSQNLVAWFPFSGNVNDSSGNGNTGTPNAVMVTSDRLGQAGKAYNFNGVSSYIIIPAVKPMMDIKGSITVAAWVKFNPASAAGSLRQIVWHGDGAINYDPYSLVLVNGMYSFRRDPGAFSDSVSTPFIDTGFHHLAGTFDSSTGRYCIYIDGNLARTKVATAGAIPYSTTNFGTVIGAVNAGNGQNFPGTIDQAVLYNRALSFCEIQRLYMEGNSINVISPGNPLVVAGQNATFTVNISLTGISYQWQQNTGAGFSNLANSSKYSGVTANTLTVYNIDTSMNHYTYRCVITLAGGCTDSTATGTLNVIPAGVAQLTNAALLAVAPNPAGGDMIITVNAVLLKKEFVVTDMAGKVVIKGIFNHESNLIPASALSKGVYLLKAQGMAEAVRVVKF